MYTYISLKGLARGDGAGGAEGRLQPAGGVLHRPRWPCGRAIGDHHLRDLHGGICGAAKGLHVILRT